MSGYWSWTQINVFYYCNLKNEVTQSYLILRDPMDCSPPGSSKFWISRQEYWIGLPFPSPGDVPNPEIELKSFLLQAGSLPASMVAQLVKNPPAMWDTWVQSLGWENPLEKGKAAHSTILAWKIPLTIQSMGLQRVRHYWMTFTLLFLTILLCLGFLSCEKGTILVSVLRHCGED